MGSAESARAGDRSLTDNQRLAVESEKALICVMAGPGSGKTRVLTGRVIARVAAGKLAIERALAITFTENAAAEMKTRLTEAFERPDLEEHLRRVETAYISTIHGFCARLLRENAVEAGVDPRFDVLDEMHSALLKEETLTGLLDQWDGRDPNGLHEFSRHFRNKEYAELLLGVYDTIRRLGGDPADTAELLAVREPFERVVAEVRQAAQATLDNARGQARETARQVIAALSGMESAAPEGVFQSTCLVADAIYKKQNITELREAIKGRLVPAAVEEAAAGHRRSVAELLARLHAAYGARKQALSALDFEDLEQLTLRMLRGSPSLLGRLRERFKEILVDEYQDTSPLQSGIIELLAEGLRLFVVGDPAQSIYGFRKAEPAAFLRMWKRAENGGEPVDLREDFRSRPEIIDAVNRHFLPNFAATGTPFQPLAPGSRFRSRDVPSVEMMLIAQEDAGLDEIRPREARHLARRILQLDGKLMATHPDSEPKRLGFGDIAILFRSSTNIQTYERALDEFGVPYYSETSRGFYETREVRDLISFLRALDNSRDEVAVAAVLRSPIFGLSDDALYLMAHYAHAAGGLLGDVLDEAAAIPEFPAEDAGRVRRFQSLLAELRRRAAWRPLAELIRDIIHATGYDATLFLEPNGRRKAANLYKLADVAAALEAGGFESTINELLRAIERFRLEEAREGEAQIDAASENAVRLMTMHAAKGLEFPIVIVPDLSRGDNPQRDYLDFLPGFGLGVQFNCAGPFEQPDIQKTLTLAGIRAELDRRETAEELRVLFVAMTRAKEHLILSGCLKSKNGQFKAERTLAAVCASFGLPIEQVPITGQWVTQRIGQGPGSFELAVCATDEEPAAPSPHEAPVAIRYRAALEAGSALAAPVTPETEAEANRIAAGALAPRPEADPSESMAAVTDVMVFHRCPRRYYLGRYLGYPEPTPFTEEPEAPGAEAGGEEEGGQDDGDGFARWELGRAVHDVLARGPQALADVPEKLRPEAERLAAGFQRSEWAARINAAAGVRWELALVASLDGRFLNGTLDVLTFEDGRPGVLLDYKSNDISAAEVDRETAQYRVQMLLYALLIRAAFGELPRDAVLFYLAPGAARKVELSEAALEEARGVLAAFFEAQRRLAFPAVAADHCYRCPFHGGLCPAM